MVNVNKLKGKIVEKGYTQESFSAVIGMNKSTLSRKIKTGEDFSVGQASKIIKVLSMTKEDALSIFFSNIVA